MHACIPLSTRAHRRQSKRVPSPRSSRAPEFPSTRRPHAEPISSVRESAIVSEKLPFSCSLARSLTGLVIFFQSATCLIKKKMIGF
jgi:hypothetical protein